MKTGKKEVFNYVISILILYTLPNDKILDWSKLKSFADDKINVTEQLKFVLGRVENILWGKDKNAGNSIFSFSYHVFKRFLFQGRWKSGLCVKS